MPVTRLDEMPANAASEEEFEKFKASVDPTKKAPSREYMGYDLKKFVATMHVLTADCSIEAERERYEELMTEVMSGNDKKGAIFPRREEWYTSPTGHGVITISYVRLSLRDSSNQKKDVSSDEPGVEPDPSDTPT